MTKVELDLTPLKPGERLRKLRGMRGLKGVDLADLAKVSNDAISKFELGRGDYLTPDDKQRIAHELGVPAKLIFGDLS